MAYRKRLILHLWEIRQNYEKTYATKAALVRRAQQCFVGFLFSLLLLCALVTGSVL